MRLKFVELRNCRQEFERIQQKYEQLLQSAPDAMVFVNKGAKIVATGLGLPIAKNIIEEEGGILRITSAEEGGTTVTLLFPDLQTA